VRVGYDVFAKNLEIGRRAASQFSQGHYNFRQVPQDAGLAMQEIIRLLRELSENAFDICDRLAQQLSNSTSPKPNPPVPPFRSAPNGGAAPGPAAPAQMGVSVTFAGSTKGAVVSSGLNRPQGPTSPDQIEASPLLPRDNAAAPITQVTFGFDIASGGLTAIVTAPDGQAEGVYSGVVWAKTQDAPLGVLAVEILS